RRRQRLAGHVAAPGEGRRPESGGNEVQHQETGPAQRAHAHRERADVAHAINEAIAQDEADAVALEQTQRPVDHRLSLREALEHAWAVTPAEKKIALIAGEAAEPGARQENRQAEQAV